MANLTAIVEAAAPRLCALIFGIADYSADVGLPVIHNEHPVADWVRAEVVNAAGGVGVPAIDAMTLAFPVADASLDGLANRERFLTRMARVYQDAERARDLGMAGKWVGHPAQLFAVLLAFDAMYASQALEAEVEKLRAYQQTVVHDGRGATVIDGVMSDRATDRHARRVLRQATALGLFDPGRARVLGVIDEAEAAELAGRRASGGGE